VEAADGARERVGRVVGARHGLEGEDAADHIPDL